MGTLDYQSFNQEVFFTQINSARIKNLWDTAFNRILFKDAGISEDKPATDNIGIYVECKENRSGPVGDFDTTVIPLLYTSKSHQDSREWKCMAKLEVVNSVKQASIVQSVIYPLDQAAMPVKLCYTNVPNQEGNCGNMASYAFATGKYLDCDFAWSTQEDIEHIDC